MGKDFSSISLVFFSLLLHCCSLDGHIKERKSIKRYLGGLKHHCSYKKGIVFTLNFYLQKKIFLTVSVAVLLC